MVFCDAMNMLVKLRMQTFWHMPLKLGAAKQTITYVAHAGDIAGSPHDAVHEVLMRMGQHSTGGSQAIFMQGAAASTLHAGPATSCTDGIPIVNNTYIQDAMASAVSLQSAVATSWEKIIDGAQVQQDCPWNGSQVEHPTIPVHQGIAALLATTESGDVHCAFPKPSQNKTVQVLPNKHNSIPHGKV